MMILLDVDIDNVFDDSGESSPFAPFAFQTLMTMILLDIGDVVDDIAR